MRHFIDITENLDNPPVDSYSLLEDYKPLIDKIMAQIDKAIDDAAYEDDKLNKSSFEDLIFYELQRRFNNRHLL